MAGAPQDYYFPSRGDGLGFVLQKQAESQARTSVPQPVPPPQPTMRNPCKGAPKNPLREPHVAGRRDGTPQPGGCARAVGCSTNAAPGVAATRETRADGGGTGVALGNEGQTNGLLRIRPCVHVLLPFEEADAPSSSRVDGRA